MREIIIHAPAKINLALDVLGRRADGYHELSTIMQVLTLYDTLRARQTDQPGVRLISDNRLIPQGPENLAVKGAQAVLLWGSAPAGVEIHLEKRVPVAAGLGGGSADCAAAMVAARELYNLLISDDEMAEIGLSLGADVPFCLFAQRGGKTALCQGRGEKIAALPPHPPAVLLLAKPEAGVSTAAVYGGYDRLAQSFHPDTEGMAEALRLGDLPGVMERLGNGLSAVTEGYIPVVTDIRMAMLSAGALAACMSGSGPTVFGYFFDKKAARAAALILRSAGAAEVIATEIA